MRLRILLTASIAATGVAFVVGCSAGTSVSPETSSRSSDAHIRPGGIAAYAVNRRNTKGYYSCPATGAIEYVSDFNSGNIGIYAGKFQGQTECGQIVAYTPRGLHIDRKTHDLYVANGEAHNVVVFHRGQTTPYNTYLDPTGQILSDVTLQNDGTIIASSLGGNYPEEGSISTWINGPNGGSFVGNFPMTLAGLGGFISIDKNDMVYFNDYDFNVGVGSLWSVSCPGGVCGTQTQVAGVYFTYPGGLLFDSAGDLVSVNSSILTTHTGTADIFELPNSIPKFFVIPGEALGVALDASGHHLFIADHSEAEEYLFPSGKLVGTVTDNFGGQIAGVAFDP